VPFTVCFAHWKQKFFKNSTSENEIPEPSRCLSLTSKVTEWVLQVLKQGQLLELLRGEVEARQAGGLGILNLACFENIERKGLITKLGKRIMVISGKENIELV
jgi:hypothetical protein